MDSYPAWQAWLRVHQPPMLVMWGRYDPSFIVPGAEGYKRDVPTAELHILDAGHFALDEATDEVARLTRDFLDRHLSAVHPIRNPLRVGIETFKGAAAGRHSARVRLGCPATIVYFRPSLLVDSRTALHPLLLYGRSRPTQVARRRL